MSQQELLIQVVDVLYRLEIPYLITGSWASTIQGEPRSSHDIDLVVSLDTRKISRLVDSFSPPRFYVDRNAMRTAIEKHSMFNLLDTTEGDKVDFWMLTNEPWDRSRWIRRVEVRLWGREFWISSPEDTILAKLRWSILCGGSEKQFGDALRVFELNAPTLDFDYLSQWAKTLGAESLWLRIQAESNLGKD